MERLNTIPGTEPWRRMDVISTSALAGSTAGALIGAYWPGKRAISACRSGKCRGWRGTSASTGPLSHSLDRRQLGFPLGRHANISIVKRHLDKHHPTPQLFRARLPAARNKP